jgi:hypothetical protein
LLGKLKSIKIGTVEHFAMHEIWNKIVFSEGGPYERGMIYGRTTGFLIKDNIRSFWKAINHLGVSRGCLLKCTEENISPIKPDEEFYEYLKGMARGAKVPLLDILAMNIFRQIIFPDECTVLIALRDSTADGSTLVLKNSDKIGSEKFVGPRFYKNKEINVVIFEKPDAGNDFVAVAAAGAMAVKIGMNERGVAVGTNIARTIELKKRKVDVSQIRALDRGWLGREGLIKGGNAREAAQLVLKLLVEKPMSTPGNIEFIDGEGGYIIEGSYDRIAIQFIKEGVHARSNRFVVLESLNDPTDVSSYVRYVRSMELLLENKGKIDVQKMIEFSQDHKHGPSLNSICRHSQDFRDETSLASAVMEIDPNNPRDSVFHVALGKPCKAWRDGKAHTSIKLSMEPELVPKGFYDGTVFKNFYLEEL